MTNVVKIYSAKLNRLIEVDIDPSMSESDQLEKLIGLSNSMTVG